MPLGSGNPVNGWEPLGKARGGLIKRYAGGGAVDGRDSIPALLMPDEYVVQRSAADAVGTDFLDGLNSMTKSKVRAMSSPRMPTPAGGSKQEMNVWLVSKDQAPVPTKNDIVATVGQDIASGGPIKTLIKQVIQGG